MATYTLKKDIICPLGCVDKGTIATQGTPNYEYIYFPYKGCENMPIAMGNGILFHKEYLENEWVEVTD